MKRALLVGTVLGSMVGLLFACDDDDSPAAPTSPDGSIPIDGSVPDGSPSVGDNEDPATVEGLFNSYVSVNALKGGMTGSASFTLDENATCPLITVNGCTFYDCSGGAPTPTYDSPGTLTVTGGSPSKTMTFTNAPGGYQQGTTGEEADLDYDFTPGSSLAFAATGATVPAFEDAVEIPGAFTWTAPSTAFPPALSVDRNVDLPLRWTGASSAVGFMIRITPNGQPSVSITCEIAGTDGDKAAVSSEILKHLPAGKGVFSFWAVQAKAKTVGAYRIRESVAYYFDNSHEVEVK